VYDYQNFKSAFITLFYSLLKVGMVRFIIFVVCILLLLTNSINAVQKKYDAFNVCFTKQYFYESDFFKLQKYFKEYVSVLDYVEKVTSRNDIFLLFRDSEFPLYVDRKFFSLLDPLLISIYRADSCKKIYDYLKKLQIRYLYVPCYPIPEIFNTKISFFKDNPKYTSLMFSDKYFKLYRVNKSIKNNVWESTDIARNSIKQMLFIVKVVLNSKFKKYIGRLSVNQKHKYYIKVNIQGKSSVSLHVIEFNENGKVISSHILDKFMSQKERKTFNTVYLPSVEVSFCKFLYKNYGEEKVVLSDHLVYEISEK